MTAHFNNLCLHPMKILLFAAMAIILPTTGIAISLLEETIKNLEEKGFIVAPVKKEDMSP
jgi:hypothetical protein